MAKTLSKLGLRRSNLERNIVPILGVPVDSTRRRGVLMKIQKFLEILAPQAQSGRSGKLFIVTPNPEIVNLASKDTSFRKTLGQAHLSLPDGIGIIMAQRYIVLQVPKFPVVTQLALVCVGFWIGASGLFNRRWLISAGETVPGRLVFEDLVKLASKKGWRVFLLGGGKGVAEKAAKKIQNLKIKNQNYDAKFKILGMEGPRLDMEGKPQGGGEAQIERETIEEINTFKPDLLFVGFGAPKQEYWLYRNLPKLNVRVGMVVGGTFDSVAGTVMPAPRFVTEAGLEWVWRLITQPWRIGRIFNAVVVFPLKVLIWRLKHG